MSFLFRKREAPAEQPEQSQKEETESASKTSANLNTDRDICISKLRQVLAPGQKEKGAVLKLHLENYKLVNDTFGYEYAEEMLGQIIEYLKKVSGGAVYRYMGVEFLLIMEQCGYSKALDLADKITERFYNVWTVNKVDCVCSISGGIAFFPGYTESYQELIKMLDHAVLESSASGLNKFTVYDNKLREKMIRKQKIAFSIQESLKKDDVEIRYRPTWHVPEQKFTRAECTYRIFIPEIGIVQAYEFLPIAEDSGQICDINYYAIQKVCAFIESLIKKGKQFESIAVPISPVMFLQEKFLDKVQDLLYRYQIPEKKLALELSESVLISTFPNVDSVMQGLSDMGVELVLNDFGTGYSGINNILSLPVDVLKLERMFIFQLETNPPSGYVIQGLIQIARNLGVKLIAEGVETEKQLALLKEYGCEYQQGFYYSATVEAEELEGMLS